MDEIYSKKEQQNKVVNNPMRPVSTKLHKSRKSSRISVEVIIHDEEHQDKKTYKHTSAKDKIPVLKNTTGNMYENIRSFFFSHRRELLLALFAGSGTVCYLH
jgi:hypothetical protein